jgi:hypothetical protein
MVPRAYQVILFDLGGVLVEVDGVVALQRGLGQHSFAPGYHEFLWIICR